MLPSVDEYERFVYSLLEEYPTIVYSTLVLASHSPSVSTLKGEVAFEGDIRLVVLEVVDFAEGSIVDYSYEVRRGDEKLYWYDCWPHPHIPSLQSSHPHHKHVPPIIKENRVPAPQIAFDKPNLAYLISEVQSLLNTGQAG